MRHGWFTTRNRLNLGLVTKIIVSVLPKGPFKYYVSKEVGGWGQKMAIVAD